MLMRTLLRARPERPRGRRTAEKRDEVAAFHCPMPPVLPTERIAHLGTADCCIHPPGRYETIAVTPPIIFSKEVAQNRPPHFSPEPPSAPEIVLRQISGDGVWMHFRFSRALPPGPLAHAGTRGIPSDGRCRAGPRRGRDQSYSPRPLRRRFRPRRRRKGGQCAVRCSGLRQTWPPSCARSCRPPELL